MKPILYQFNRKSFLISTLANIKGWDTNLKYFLVGNIYLSFNTINRRRLKNIFLKVVNNINLWNEIEKMINCNLINISDSSIYMKSNFLETSLLASWLLDIYLNEFDLFLKGLIHNFSSKINVYSFNKNFSKKFCSDFLPLRLEYSLYEHKILKFFFVNEYHFLNVSFLNNSLRLQLNLSRMIYFTRYLNFFCLGLIGSKRFSLSLKRKIISFVRSNLFFDIKGLNILSPFEDYVYFLGFNISVLNLMNMKSNRLKLKIKAIKNYQIRFLSRLNFFNLRMAALLNNRIRIELFSNLMKIMEFRRKNFPYQMNMKLWTFLFQLESIRSIQYEKVIFSEDQASSFTNEIFSATKNFRLKEYRKYYIGLYAKKVKLVLHDIFETFPFFINKSVLPLDSSISFLFDEFKKKFSFFYESMVFSSLDYDPFFINNVSTFLKNSTDLRTSNNSVLQKKYTSTYYKVIKINSPIKYIFEKLRLLGFIHPFKKRPISNSKYLSFSDVFIIKSFGYIANSILSWFRLWCVVFFICCYSITNKII